jgi:hypothetical protein
MLLIDDIYTLTDVIIIDPTQLDLVVWVASRSDSDSGSLNKGRTLP